MAGSDPSPETNPAGDRPPPRPPHGSAVGLGPEGDGFDKNSRATITKVADGEGKFIRQSDTRGEYGHVIVRIEPNVRGKGIVISSEAPVGTIAEEFIKPVTEGVREALDGGAVVGCPIVDIIVRIAGGSTQQITSSDLAFKMAAIFAIKDAIKKADPIVIGPK